MTFFAALAGLVVRFRWLVIGGWLIALAAATVALPSLSSEVNSDPSLFLAGSAPSVEAASLGAPLLGSRTTSRITIVAAASSGTLTRADEDAIVREGRLAKQVSGVQSVRLVALSPAGNAVQLTATVGRDTADVAGLKPVVDALEATFPQAGAPPGLQLQLAGQVATNAANNKSASKAMGRITLFSILFIIMLLLVVLRSPVAVLVTFVPSAVALLVSERFIAGLGRHGLQISSITQTLLIVLLLGAGTDYGLFLVYRFREELRGGRQPHDAVVTAFARVGESITASAGTVILALLTLLFGSFGLYHDLGVPLALGIAVMLLAGLTLLPALLAVTAGVMFPGTLAAGSAGTGHDGRWGRVAARAVRRPAAVLGIGVLVFAALALAATNYRTASLDRSTTAPAGSDAAVGNAILAADFPQSSASPSDLILRYAAPVWTHPQELATAARLLQSSGLFTGLAAPLDPNGTTLSPAVYAALHAALGDPRSLPLTEPAVAAAKIPASLYNAYRATAQYVSADGRTVRFAAGLRAGQQQSTAAMNATPAVRAAVAGAATASGATASGVAGQAAALYDVSSTASGDMVLIIPLAVLAIALLLALVLRSLVAPLYLVVTIGASYLAALGLTTFLVITLGGQDGLVFILPFLMFVFLLALGEDYNILIMTRIREEARTLPLKDAVVRAIGRTGPTVTSAGLILAGTFGVFALAGGDVMNGQLQAIGLGLALGVLLDTFGVRTLLVPSIVVLLGRWNWWPSRLSRGDGPAGQPAAQGDQAGDLLPEISDTGPLRAPEVGDGAERGRRDWRRIRAQPGVGALQCLGVEHDGQVPAGGRLGAGRIRGVVGRELPFHRDQVDGLVGVACVVAWGGRGQGLGVRRGDDGDPFGVLVPVALRSLLGDRQQPLLGRGRDGRGRASGSGAPGQRHQDGAGDRASHRRQQQFPAAGRHQAGRHPGGQYQAAGHRNLPAQCRQRHNLDGADRETVASLAITARSKILTGSPLPRLTLAADGTVTAMRHQRTKR
jgi:putative drug exporter of the RND superfamily